MPLVCLPGLGGAELILEADEPSHKKQIDSEIT